MIFDKNLNSVPYGHEREAYKETKSASYVRNQWDEGVDQNLFWRKFNNLRKKKSCIRKGTFLQIDKDILTSRSIVVSLETAHNEKVKSFAPKEVVSLPPMNLVFKETFWIVKLLL